MSVGNGRQILSIPGPTTVPDAVLNAMHQPAVDIYSGRLLHVTESLLEDLKMVHATQGSTYIYAANGHGAWEAAISNVLSRGDKVLVLESGRFAVGWGEMGQVMGIDIEVLPGDWRRAVDPIQVEQRLKDDTAGEIKAVMMVQVDTASGVWNDVSAVRQAIDAAGHDALFMVDVIASLACVPFEMDAWGVDVAVGGSQKGLMTPPGLSFNAVSDKAQARRKAGTDLKTHYWDWGARDGEQHYQKYCGTPPQHLLFGLRQAVDILKEEGLPNVFCRHALLAEATRRAVAVWAEGSNALDFNVTETAERSDSVTTVRMAEGVDPGPLLDYCQDQCGVTVGVGIGALTGKAFRIAHMGHCNAPMVIGTLGAIEMGLAATGIGHGRGGVQAAVDYLADNVPAG